MSTNLARAFYFRLGKFVSAHPWWNLILPLILCLASLYGYTNIHQDIGIRNAYTPDGARAREEFAAYGQFFEKQGEPWLIYILLTSPSGHSLIDKEPLDEIVRLMDYLSENFTVAVEGNTYKYTEVCGSFCDSNKVIRSFVVALETQRDLQSKNKSLSKRVNISYPLTTVPVGELFMAANLFDVSMKDKDKMEKDEITAIDHVSMVVVEFHMTNGADPRRDILTAWELGLPDTIQSLNLQHIEAYTFGDAILAEEVSKAGRVIVPYVSLGFLLLTIFAAATMALESYYRIGFKRLVLLAVAATTTPLLAVVTGLGLMFAIGFRFDNILNITPFLILAIGVDDAFLLVHSFNRVETSREKSGGNSNSNLPDTRLAEAFADAGPSITVTSLTNAIAFGVGIFVPYPQIRLFCVGCAFGMALDLLFEVTVFAAILVLVEQQPTESDTKEKTEIQGIDDLFKPVRAFGDRFLKRYVAFLTTVPAAVLLAIFLALLWTVSGIGSARMLADKSPAIRKVLLRDSPILKTQQLMRQYVWKDYNPILVLVHQCPDLTNETSYQRLIEMVEQFEATENSLGRDATRFWLRDFEKFQQSLAEFLPRSDEFDSELLHDFFKWPEYSHWNSFVQWRESSPRHATVDSFYFTTAYRNLSSWKQRTDALTEWRRMADSYPEFGVTVFEPEAYRVDQIVVLQPTTVQAIVVTVCSMVVICLLFVPHFSSVLIAAAAICSINFGVFGLLGWFGETLDFINFITTLMSIGFSVDFIAHVTYHYYHSGRKSASAQENVEVHLEKTLAAIGFPTLQAGLSTVLCISTLAFVDSYMAQVFLKTVVCCVSLGFVHGLFAIPLILSRLPRRFSLTSLCCARFSVVLPISEPQ